MFSKPIHAEGLTFFCIAYEEKSGRLVWWKPHYYKLVETFGEEARACFGFPRPARGKQLNRLFTKIENCLADDPGATEALSICVVKRCVRHDKDTGWHLVDILVARRLTALQSRIN